MIRAGTKAFQYIAFLPAGLVCPSLLMVGFVTAGNGGFIAALNRGEMGVSLVGGREHGVETGYEVFPPDLDWPGLYVALNNQRSKQP
jgi:hypothetical protein